MTPEQAIAELAQRCRYNLYYLDKYVLNYTLMEEEVHGDLCKYVEALLPSHPADYVFPQPQDGTGMEDQFKQGNQSTLILMPRGTFKSSVVTIGFTLQYILNDPNARILIDSETHTKAKAFLSEVKDHLEGNALYREVFKHIHGVYPEGVVKKKKDLLWTDSQLRLACRTRAMKEPSIMVSGIDKSINGMHFDLIICDDLHSERNVTNKEQIQQVIDHWKLAYSLIDPGKPVIVIGTRWDYNDLYQEILDLHREEFNIIVRRAVKDDGTAFFPQRLPLEELEKIKKKQGNAHFSNQYQNEPISEEDAPFKRESIIRREWKIVKDRPINWYLMVDPSFEGPYSDFAALVVGGMDYQRDIYVRHVLRKKMNYSQIIDNIFDLNNRYKPKVIVIKVVASAKSLMYELNNEMKRRGVWLPIRELRDNKQGKEDRIKALCPFYEYGHAFHIADCPQLDELEYEMLHFPKGKHDDILDAYASLLEIATPPNSKTTPEGDDEYSRHRVAFKPRSPQMGY